MPQDLIVTSNGGVDVLGSLILHSSNIIALSAGGGGGGSGTVITGNRTWVDSVSGNDSTGLVQRIDKPFLTISAAVSAIRALSTSSLFIVEVAPGNYFNETDLTCLASPNIIIKGACTSSIDGNAIVQVDNIPGSPFTADPGTSSTPFGGIISITSEEDFDLSNWGLNHGGGIFMIDSCLIQQNILVTGATGIDININNCDGTSSNMTITNNSTQLNINNSNFGSINFTSGGGSGTHIQCFNSSINSITGDTATTLGYYINLTSSPVATLTLNNTGSSGGINILSDAISFPSDLSGIVSSIHPILKSNVVNLAYIPADTVNWSSINPKNVANALDRIAAKVGPIS